jgi:predicted PurR-regulated permease PerM
MHASPEQQESGVLLAAQSPRQGWPITLTARGLWKAVSIVGGTVLLLLVISKAFDALLLLFVAIILAEGIRPLMNGLKRLHVPRPLAIICIYVAVLSAAVGLVWLLARPLVDQVVAFTNNLPTYAQQLRDLANQAEQAANSTPGLSGAVSAVEAKVAQELSNFLPTLLTIPFSAVNVLFSVLVVLTMTFFWLTSLDALRPFMLGLLPIDEQDRADALLDDLSRTLGGYLRGVVVNMLVIGGLTGLGLFVLGVPYALLLGIVAGLTEVIPILGPWISGAVAVLVALATGGLDKALEVFVLFQVVQQLEGNTVVPLVMSRAVKINPLAVVLAVLIGGALYGIPGAVLGVPAAGVVQIVIRRVLAPLAAHASHEPPKPAEALVTVAATSTVDASLPTELTHPADAGA